MSYKFYVESNQIKIFLSGAFLGKLQIIFARADPYCSLNLDFGPSKIVYAELYSLDVEKLLKCSSKSLMSLRLIKKSYLGWPWGEEIIRLLIRFSFSGELFLK